MNYVTYASRVRRHARTALFLLVLCTAGGTWVSAQSQDTNAGVLRLPQDIVYKGLPGAPQHVTLFGDSSRPGLYVDRIKFAPGMKVMPHWHPDSVRTVLVLSGTFYFAVGEQWDESQLQGLSCWHAIFRTCWDAALCMGQGRRSDPAGDGNWTNRKHPNSAKKQMTISRAPNVNSYPARKCCLRAARELGTRFRTRDRLQA